MQWRSSPWEAIRWENHLFALNGLVAIACLLFVWYTPRPAAVTIPEVIVPLGIALGLSVYTVILRRRGPERERSRSMVRYAWIGALLSSLVGVVWLGLHLFYGLPIDVLPDKILTVLSVGIAAGVLIGQIPSPTRPTHPEPGRTHVVAETSWTNRSEAAPILDAVVEALAEVEGVDPLELSPLYEQFDPDTLSRLRSQNTQWQLLFYRHEYEIRVSSHGTVTISSLDPPEEVARPFSPPEESR